MMISLEVVDIVELCDHNRVAYNREKIFFIVCVSIRGWKKNINLEEKR